MYQKKKSKVVPVCITLFVVIAVIAALVYAKCAGLIGGKDNHSLAAPVASEEATDPAALDNQTEKTAETEPTEPGFHEIQPGEDISNVVVDVKQSPKYVEPGAGALQLDQIQGLTVPDNQSSGQSSESGSTPAGTTLSDSNLTAEVVARYAGSFVEDGTNTATADVTAMVVTNNSDQMLQIGIVEFQVNETETAEFTVTNLPAGASALVLENSQRPFRADDDFSYGKVAASYIDTPSLESDKFDFLEEEGKLTLVNKTDETYGKVYVYYKYVQLGGAYLGGITYRVPFENVPANGQVESVAGHFRPEGSKIIAVVIMPEE